MSRRLEDDAMTILVWRASCTLNGGPVQACAAPEGLYVGQESIFLHGSENLSVSRPASLNVSLS